MPIAAICFSSITLQVMRLLPAASWRAYFAKSRGVILLPGRFWRSRVKALASASDTPSFTPRLVAASSVAIATPEHFGLVGSLFWLSKR